MVKRTLLTLNSDHNPAPFPKRCLTWDIPQPSQLCFFLPLYTDSFQWVKTEYWGNSEIILYSCSSLNNGASVPDRVAALASFGLKALKCNISWPDNLKRFHGRTQSCWFVLQSPREQAATDPTALLGAEQFCFFFYISFKVKLTVTCIRSSE